MQESGELRRALSKSQRALEEEKTTHVSELSSIRAQLQVKCVMGDMYRELNWESLVKMAKMDSEKCELQGALKAAQAALEEERKAHACELSSLRDQLQEKCVMLDIYRKLDWESFMKRDKEKCESQSALNAAQTALEEERKAHASELSTLRDQLQEKCVRGDKYKKLYMESEMKRTREKCDSQRALNTAQIALEAERKVRASESSCFHDQVQKMRNWGLEWKACHKMAEIRWTQEIGELRRERDMWKSPWRQSERALEEGKKSGACGFPSLRDQVRNICDSAKVLHKHLYAGNTVRDVRVSSSGPGDILESLSVDSSSDASSVRNWGSSASTCTGSLMEDSPDDKGPARTR